MLLPIYIVLAKKPKLVAKSARLTSLPIVLNAWNKSSYLNCTHKEFNLIESFIQRGALPWFKFMFKFMFLGQRGDGWNPLRLNKPPAKPHAVTCHVTPICSLTDICGIDSRRIGGHAESQRSKDQHIDTKAPMDAMCSTQTSNTCDMLYDNPQQQTDVRRLFFEGVYPICLGGNPLQLHRYPNSAAPTQH